MNMQTNCCLSYDVLIYQILWIQTMHRLKRLDNFDIWTWPCATSVYIEDKIGQGVGNVLIYQLCCGNRLCINEQVGQL